MTTTGMGALRLSYDFEYAVLEEADKNANTNFDFDIVTPTSGIWLRARSQRWMTSTFTERSVTGTIRWRTRTMTRFGSRRRGSKGCTGRLCRI